MAMGKQRNHRQQEVLLFIQSYVDDHGFSPTYEEIREALGLSSRSHVSYYLDALEQGGLIDRLPRSPRGLRPTGLDLAAASTHGDRTQRVQNREPGCQQGLQD